MRFNTRICGIPCICEVQSYVPDTPIRVYGPAMEDADPPEEGEFEYNILDRMGYPAPWLELLLTPAAEEQLREDVHIMHMARDYDMDPS